MTAITICLWYDGQAQEAAELYTSVVEGGRILHVQDLPPSPGTDHPKIVEFELAGTTFTALDGGPGHPHSDAASIMLRLGSQEEVDRVWEALLADGGQEVQCGWLADRFGVSWQIVPEGFFELLQSEDQEAVGRAYAAIMTMKKLDLPALQAAFDGVVE